MRGGRPRVVDFSTHFSGPLASQLLIQFGADVIKVENPRLGDGNRGLKPQAPDLKTSVAHVALNSGARSLAMDRKDPRWQELVAACTRWADVLVVGGQPEAIESRGLGFQSAVANNDRIIYCSITGYGREGPLRTYPAHGINPDAFAGIVPVAYTDGRPEVHQEYHSLGTPLAGVFAALGILEALRRRDKHNEAQRVDVSLWGAAMWTGWRHLAALSNADQPWHSYSDIGSRYCMYSTADDRAIIICPIEKKYWESFCDVIGLPADWKDRGDWSASGMYHGNEEEKPVIGELMRRKTLAELFDLLEASGVPFAPILSPAEALASEQAEAERVLIHIANPNGARSFGVPRSPVAITTPGVTDPRDMMTPPPDVGQDTSEILADVGFEMSGGG